MNEIRFSEMERLLQKAEILSVTDVAHLSFPYLSRCTVADWWMAQTLDIRRSLDARRIPDSRNALHGLDGACRRNPACFPNAVLLRGPIK
ncbi:hypothetical protein [Pseudomonas sp. Q1]|uniref:hypothetical protein n=1 Tax=Pseudomonas sp. Q1 TaxID=2202823 RepID=UPI001374BA2D|nr:hypothetical protein [Pseudomonas sp. Q1]